MKKQRQDRLLKLLEQNPLVTDEELAGVLKSSVSTIRLDRAVLAIPELRERMRRMAQKASSRLRSLKEEEVVGDLLELEPNRWALSALQTRKDMAFRHTDALCDHYVYAQASLSISGVTDIARNIKTQKLVVEQGKLNLESVKNDLIRTVKKNYYALLSASRAVEIRTKSRDLYKDQYERAEAYYKLGLRPKVDVTTAEVNLNNEELRLIRAKNLVKTASADLANSLGITVPDVLKVEEIASFEKFDKTFDEAVQTAYANRPDVESARTDVRISQIKLNQAKAGFFPTFSLSAGYTKSGDDFYLDNEDTKLLAAVEWPIFNAFKTYNGVKQAKISLENTLNDNRSLLNNVFLEVQSAYIKMQEAAESIPIAELNVEKAKENLELAQGRYNEGIGDVIELKDAEVAYTDAELSLLTSRYDYASAVADLKQAMGTN